MPKKSYYQQFKEYLKRRKEEKKRKKEKKKQDRVQKGVLVIDTTGDMSDHIGDQKPPSKEEKDNFKKATALLVADHKEKQKLKKNRENAFLSTRSALYHEAERMSTFPPTDVVNEDRLESVKNKVELMDLLQIPDNKFELVKHNSEQRVPDESEIDKLIELNEQNSEQRLSSESEVTPPIQVASSDWELNNFLFTPSTRMSEEGVPIAPPKILKKPAKKTDEAKKKNQAKKKNHKKKKKRKGPGRGNN